MNKARPTPADLERQLRDLTEIRELDIRIRRLQVRRREAQERVDRWNAAFTEDVQIDERVSAT